MWLEPFLSCGASANVGQKSVQRPNLLLACHVAKGPSVNSEHPKNSRCGEVVLIQFTKRVRVPGCIGRDGRRGVLGTRGAQPSREPQRARRMAASGGGRLAKRGAAPCLRARAARSAISTRARRNSAARRVFVVVGNRRVWQAGDCRHSTPAQVAPVDAAHCATRAVSRLRKSKPYAQR
jgi:hypothetical protein